MSNALRKYRRQQAEAQKMKRNRGREILTTFIICILAAAGMARLASLMK